MKSQRPLLLTVLLVMSGSICAFSGEPKVIANLSVQIDKISADEVKKIFLEEKNSLADGTHVEPVFEKNGPAHEAFLRQYLGSTDNDLRFYFQALVFSGRGSTPKELRSDAEVVAYVAKTRGAIGYVSAETSTEGVKTLTVVNTQESAQRKLITRVEPDYPETLKRLSIGGTVRLQATISPKGNVETVALLGGNPILSESAAAAVKQWIYSSGPSRTTLEVSISFDPHR